MMIKTAKRAKKAHTTLPPTLRTLMHRCPCDAVAPVDGAAAQARVVLVDRLMVENGTR